MHYYYIIITFAKIGMANLNPLLTVNLNSVSSKRSYSSVNDFFHHLCVAIGFLQLGGCDPDVSICRDILTCLV